MATSQQQQTVELTSLSPAQLSGLKKQLDDELEHLTTSFTRLRAAQAKFRECVKSIQEGLMAASAEGKDILIPMTTSLYVPGKMAETEKVIVDVGTGYFVEKNTKDATEFYTAKIDELTVNLKDLESIVQGKSNSLRVVEDVLRQKVLSGATNTNTAGTGAGTSTATTDG